MSSSKNLTFVAILFWGVSVFSVVQIHNQYVRRTPLLTELVVTDQILQDLGALMLGSRRGAADLAYIQLLQYYGHHHEGEEEGHHHFEAGDYPLLQQMSLRILRLDPFFNMGILECAGALAFIELKTVQALDLLREAFERDPSFYKYGLYMSAILYKNQGQDLKLIDTLKHASKFSDCPTMFKLILGNLLKKYGQQKEAAQLYLEITRTAPNPSDQNDALYRLEILLKEFPSLRHEILGR